MEKPRHAHEAHTNLALAPRVNRDAISQGRVALLLLVGQTTDRQGAKCNSLIKLDIITDHRGRAHHEARPVIDKDALPELRAWVNIHPCALVRVLGEDSRNHRDPRPVELVREPMRRQRDDTGVREDDLFDTGSGRIIAIRGHHVAIELLANGGELSKGLPDDLLTPSFGAPLLWKRASIIPHRRAIDLLGQQLVRGDQVLGERHA